ncbi:MAG: cation:proton antiporter [Xenococcaceae cyanobacterium]
MTSLLTSSIAIARSNPLLNFLDLIWSEFQTATDNSLLLDVLVMFTTAIILVPIFKKVGLGSVLGYIFAGIIVGPSLLQVTNDIEGVREFAEYGVVLLMFLIGLELKPAKLWALRNMVFGLGLFQILLTGLCIGGVFFFLNSYLDQADYSSFKVYLLTGVALALSSTAIALPILEEAGEMPTEQGQAAFSIMLMQDIAAVPLLAIVPLMAENTAGQTVGEPFYITLLKIGGVLALMLLTIRVLLPLVALILSDTKLYELGFALIIVIIFGSGWLMEEVGLSMTLGAFIAGLMLSDSDYRRTIEAELLQHRDLLLGLFFMAVGMSIDFTLIRDNALLLFRDAFLVLLIKMAVLYGICRIFQKSHQASVRVALILSQCGEFCFVVAGICLSSGIYNDYVYRFVLVTVALTMAATPLLILAAEKLTFATAGSVESDLQTKLATAEEGQNNHIIIVGFGRIGTTVANMLIKANISYLALERDPNRLKQARQEGYKVYYAAVINGKILRTAGVSEAKAAIITISDPDACNEVLATIREINPNLPVSCRARDLEHSYQLQELGATEIILETLEASLQLGRTALDYATTQPDEIEKIVESFREDDYALTLQ